MWRHFLPFSFVSTFYPVLSPSISTLDSILSPPVSVLESISSWFDLTLTTFPTMKEKLDHLLNIQVYGNVDKSASTSIYISPSLVSTNKTKLDEKKLLKNVTKEIAGLMNDKFM